ncbi:hypothetical protein KEM48_000817 [Puccinia striiformis f. sp. tritici PST-130]|nr:hypothetical protein KEM48_000817 [Puccinia striiformis f. sp. tritici PST-130]
MQSKMFDEGYRSALHAYIQRNKEWGIQESYEEWEEASSLVEASKAKAFSAQDEQDFTVVKTMPPSHKALNVIVISDTLNHYQ